MKNIKQIGLHFLILLVMGCTHSIAQENHEHSQGASMQDLDTHLERIRRSDNTDIATRKRMLRHHMQMIQEQLQSMQSMGHGGMMGGMNHGDGEGGMGRGGMMGGMNQEEGEGGMGRGGMMGGMNQEEGEGGMARGGMMGGMNQEEGEGGTARGGMMGGMGGMMQHHNDMVKLMGHLLATQEMLLELIEE